MKKARKGVAADSMACALFENSMVGIKHQSLLQDYQELHNETEAVKKKLLIAKRKKATLLDEVRFLRHRYELLKNQPANIQPKVGFKLSRNLELRPPIVKKEKSSRKREASLKPLAQAHDLNQRGGIYNGIEASSRKSQSFFDLNQKSNTCSKKEVIMNNSFPTFDQKERVYRAHEAAANRNMTPVFDLNQISREEEEMQAGFEPLRQLEDESKNIFPRSEHDAKNSDLVLSSMCRNDDNGSNRAGKRKISWQDQVALRA
ncbi:hypothetical protein IC582_011464 [Cucumis melo]|uniref:Uncharacterized protein n=2 Tax=Cucumis melo TaxID=3656 RepID=A0A5A7URJ0_CUCMM|nr:uncharacterized protein LOC103493683 [Cucumis melo]KAA0056109.1 uncharacterized protein E6C27_scaffold323G00720 [Cucumis melo var. makuwa]TYJ96408.1 uncharacterized protein E5676_scaffold546G00350 [Cucumis melo var. makuwa]